MILEPIYQQILPFNHGYAWVQKGHKWGIVNALGETIQKPQWTGIRPLSFDDSYYKANRYGGWGILQYDGTVIVDFKYDNIRFRNGQFEEKKNKEWQIIHIL